MVVSVPLRLAKPDAIDDTRVVQLVADNGVFGAEDCFKKAGIGIETGRVEDGVFRFQEFRNFVLQIFVDILSAAYKTHGSEAKTVLFDAGPAQL